MGDGIVDLVESVSALDGVRELHAARLLILLNAFAGTDGNGAVEGLTKLAKLDFLLRYPVMLERALLAKGKSIRDVGIEDHERHSVESEMVRYRFGPWDHRYKELLNFLVAKGLVRINIEGRTVVLTLTEAGRSLAETFTSDELFRIYVRRSELLKRHFDMTATNLMRFIYDTFPEVITLRSNEVIS